MRLLLAEDDLQLCTSISKALRRAGYAVDVCADGIETQHLGTIEDYDVVLLDLGLPQRCGLDILQHWRAQAIRVPVIVLTARDAWHEKVAGFKAGCDDYLTKPFHPEELLARIAALIRRCCAAPNGEFKVGGIVLDEARRLAIVNGTTATLTHTEFRLLRYLMLHAGEVLSQSQLREHVYEDDSDRDSNLIEVYIRRLRAKLGADCITTRRGQGYAFGADVSCDRWNPG
jgi:DNA-binding response OmpR family regulator